MLVCCAFTAILDPLEPPEGLLYTPNRELAAVNFVLDGSIMNPEKGRGTEDTIAFCKKEGSVLFDKPISPREKSVTTSTGTQQLLHTHCCATSGTVRAINAVA